MVNGMFKKLLALFALFLFLSACTSSLETSTNSSQTSTESSTSPPIGASDSGNTTNSEAVTDNEGSAQPVEIAPAGASFITYIESNGIGKLAVQVSLPDSGRYSDGAGIVVEVNTFFTPKVDFYQSVDANEIGLIHISYLWPGISIAGAASEGSYDYGGEESIQGLHDVILFALGELPNAEGFFLNELSAITPLFDNVGLYSY